MTTNDNIDLLKSSYHYELPPELIASRPAEGRHNSRLLVYKAKSNQIIHDYFYNLDHHLHNGDRLVLNQSKVFPCRLIGQKPSGGKVELFLLSLVHYQQSYPVMIRTRSKKSIGDEFHFGELKAKITHVYENGTFGVKFNLSPEQLVHFVEEVGKIPIPPYIRDGESDEKDSEDYQTVFAKETGSVAAPTAGLHFSDKVFNALERKGVKKSFVTLHVGMGTFQPVKADNILDHQMHREFFEVDEQTIKELNRDHRRLIAVGTTSLRVLESSWNQVFEKSEEQPASTSIFLYPGKEVHSIRGLITNFHLPESTLIMLVSSLIGREKTLELYDIAVKKEYRFFSYGDAMLILRDE